LQNTFANEVLRFYACRMEDAGEQGVPHEQGSAGERQAHPPAPRTVDLRSLKALAHPLRVQLLDALSQFGPSTASGLAARLGESSGATSYHLRQLAKHDFVREVVGRGNARERWWERSPGSINVDTRRMSDTESGRAAVGLLLRQWQSNREQLLSTFVERGLEVFAPEWTDASAISTANVRLTVEQLAEFTSQWERVISDFAERYRSQDAPDALPVQIQFNAFPLIDVEER